jgi:hypothetical protein
MRGLLQANDLEAELQRTRQRAEEVQATSDRVIHEHHTHASRAGLPSVCLSVRLLVFLSFCCLTKYLCVYVSIYLCVCLSMDVFESLQRATEHVCFARVCSMMVSVI